MTTSSVFPSLTPFSTEALPENTTYETFVTQITMRFQAGSPFDVTSSTLRINLKQFRRFVEEKYAQGSVQYRACQAYLHTLSLGSPSAITLNNSEECFEKILRTIRQKKQVDVKIDTVRELYAFLDHARRRFGTESTEWAYCQSIHHEAFLTAVKKVKADPKQSFRLAYEWGEGVDFKSFRRHLHQKYGATSEEAQLYEFSYTRFQYERVLALLQESSTHASALDDMQWEKNGMTLTSCAHYIKEAYGKESPHTSRFKQYRLNVQKKQRRLAKTQFWWKAQTLWQQSREILLSVLHVPGMKSYLDEQGIFYNTYITPASWKEACSLKEVKTPSPSIKNFLYYLRKSKGDPKNLRSLVEKHREKTVEEFREFIKNLRNPSLKKIYMKYWELYREYLRRKKSKKQQMLKTEMGQRILDESPSILALVQGLPFNFIEEPSPKRKKIETTMSPPSSRKQQEALEGLMKLEKLRVWTSSLEEEKCEK